MAVYRFFRGDNLLGRGFLVESRCADNLFVQGLIACPAE